MRLTHQCGILKCVAVLLFVAPAFASAETLARFGFVSDFIASDVDPDVIVSGFSPGVQLQPSRSKTTASWLIRGTARIGRPQVILR